MSIKPWIGHLIVMLIIILPVFAHLDDGAIQLWDEGRLANSAIEMYLTGDPLVVTYEYEPDMWSTKPPLLIWLQVLSLKVFGLNDLALRLPTALSAIFTCLFLYWFLTKKFNAPLLGIFAVIILITTPGYVTIHGIRTADYDGTLTLFTTLYTLFFFLFLEEGRKKYFWLSITFIICAVLTKGIAGLLFFPGLILYAIYKKKVVSLVKMPQLYLGLFTFLFFVVGYYLLREQYNPGFIKAVMQNEVGGRFLDTIEGHKGDAMYYVRYLDEQGLTPWYLLCVLGIIFGSVSKIRLVRDISVFVLITCLSFLIVISMGATKLFWYVLPMYPLMAISGGIFIHCITLILIKNELWKLHITRNVLPYVFLALICVNPYIEMLQYVLRAPSSDNKADDAGIVLKKLLKEGYIYPTRMSVVFDGYQSGLDWYLKISNLRNIPVTRADLRSLDDDQLVLVFEDGLKKGIEEHYKVHVVSENNAATIYQIHGKKQQSCAFDSSACL